MGRPAIVVLCLSLSVACAHAPTLDPALRPGRMTAAGRARSFWSYDPGPGAAVLLVLHGRYGDGARMAALTRLVPRATGVDGGPRFGVIFPDGVEASWNDARRAGPAAEAGVDDIAFLDALVTRAIDAGADASRVYVVGMSNGGMMALTAACDARLGPRLAGVGTVTGLLPSALVDRCPGGPGPRVVVVHGDADPVVPYAGGLVAGRASEARVESAAGTAALFAARAGCVGAPVARTLPDRAPDDDTRVREERWPGCAASPRLYVVEGGGHTWPGGEGAFGSFWVGRTSRDVDASALLLEALVRR
jgi:polyhydroxybutyrate depolymerase